MGGDSRGAHRLSPRFVVEFKDLQCPRAGWEAAVVGADTLSGALEARRAVAETLADLWGEGTFETRVVDTLGATVKVVG